MSRLDVHPVFTGRNFSLKRALAVNTMFYTEQALLYSVRRNDCGMIYGRVNSQKILAHYARSRMTTIQASNYLSYRCPHNILLQ